MRISDWSSDVCSSDLLARAVAGDGAQVARRQVEADRAPLSGGERDALEAAKRDARRTGDVREGEVKLRDIVAGALPGVGHHGRDVQALAGAARRRPHVERAVGEACVAEAVAERIDRSAGEIAIGAPLHSVIVNRTRVGWGTSGDVRVES